jgi:hypothetical protein
MPVTGSDQNNTMLMFPNLPANLPHWPVELTAPLTSGVTNASRAWSDGCMAMSQEWLKFMATRLQHDMALPSKLSACSNVQDITREWTSFIQKAAEDYSSEWVKQAHLGNAAGCSVSDAFQKGMQQVSVARQRGP